MGLLDYITIAIFGIGIMIAGSLFSSSGRNMKSFFAGGGNIPWWISGLSLFMGFFSAGTFVVWGSIAYSMGFVAIVIQLTMAIAGFAVGIAIAPRWNKTGCLTVAEYITKRFGAGTQKLYTYIFLLISIFTTGSFLYPIAKIIEVSAGISLTTSILILGIFCMVYVAIGGLRAVVVTDVLQFIILFTAVIIVIPLSFAKIGGISAFLEKVPEGFFSVFSEEYSWVFIVAFMLYNLFFLGGNWAYVQRYTSVKTPRDARKVGLLFGGLYTFSPILWMLPPMIYRIFNPGLEGMENENAYLLMCKETMPTGMLGLMLGGMIFATASSLNATLNISAGVFTNDIYKRLRPKVNEKKLIHIARLSTIGFGVLAIFVALLIPNMGGIVNVVISIAALTGVPLYLPLIWTLFSKNLNGKVILATTIISLTVNAFFKFVSQHTIGFELNRAAEMLVGVMVPVLLLTAWEVYHKLSGSKIGVPMPVKELDSKSPADDTDNKNSIKIIALGALISGCFISAIALISGEQITMPLFMGAVLIVISAIIFFRNKKK